MPGTAGRRAWWIAPLLLAGYLLTSPKAFLLGPLTLLLLLSRPRTLREWLWIGISVAAALLMLRMPATLADRTIRASGAFFTGAFVMSSLLGIPSLFRRTLFSVGLTTGAIAGWFAVLGLHWTDLIVSVRQWQWAALRAVRPDLPDAPPAGAGIGGGPAAEAAAQFAAGIDATAHLFPALLAIVATGGGWLAWLWYHRVAARPIGRPAPLFREFRFSDHLVWAVVVAGALALAPLAEGWQVAGSNLLVYLLALYAGRGLAVIQTALVPAPFALALLLTIVAVPLLPLAVVVCTLIGLADTWLDLRRRLAPPEGAPT